MLDKTFVILGSSCWSEQRPTDIQSIAAILSESNRVLYVNPPTDMLSLASDNSGGLGVQRSIPSRVKRESNKAISKVAESLWVLDPPVILTSLNGMLPSKLFDFINRHNNRRLAKVVMWAARNIGIHPQWLINESAVFNGLYMAEMLGVDRALYFRSNRGVMQSVLSDHYKRCEQQLVKKYDAVVSYSEILCEDVRHLNCNSFNIGQGADLSSYDPDMEHVVHEDMIDIKSPIIGFIGKLDIDHTSLRLVEEVAEAFAEVSVVLVGEQDEYFKSSELHNMSNVHFLGAKDEALYADYIARFDLCINPEPSSSCCSVRYPINILRYMSMGRVVVSTSTIAVEALRYNILISNGYQDFLDLISLALQRDSSPILVERFRDFAALHSWKMCTERLYNIIDLISENDQKVEKDRSVEEHMAS